MSNFRLISSKQNSWLLPSPVHFSSILPHLKKWHHNHPFTYPNRKPRGHPLFLIFPHIQSISEPWFYFQNRSQTSPCSPILANILVVIITIETYLTSLFSLLSTYPPSVFHEAARSELLKPTNQVMYLICFSGGHYPCNKALTPNCSPELSPFWFLLVFHFISYHITLLRTPVYTSNGPSLFLLCMCSFLECGLSSLGPFTSFMSQFQCHILRMVILKLPL